METKNHIKLKLSLNLNISKMKLIIIAKTIAVGIFGMALFLNVKVTLDDPFVSIDNAVLAQTSSSSSSDGTWLCCQSQSIGCPTRDGSMYFPWDYPYWGGSFCP